MTGKRHKNLYNFPFGKKDLKHKGYQVLDLDVGIGRFGQRNGLVIPVPKLAVLIDPVRKMRH